MAKIFGTAERPCAVCRGQLPATFFCVTRSGQRDHRCHACHSDVGAQRRMQLSPQARAGPSASVCNARPPDMRLKHCTPRAMSSSTVAAQLRLQPCSMAGGSKCMTDSGTVANLRAILCQSACLQVPEHEWCHDCSTLLPAHGFYCHHAAPDGLTRCCRKCETVQARERSRQRAASPPPVLPAEKRGAGPCGRVLPLAAFYERRASADKHYSVCRQCASTRKCQQYAQRASRD